MSAPADDWVKAQADECGCRGSGTHTVRVLFRGTNGTVTWDAVPAHLAHELLERVAQSPWIRPDGTRTPRPAVVIERGRVRAPDHEPRGTFDPCVIVVRPDDIMAVQVIR